MIVLDASVVVELLTNGALAESIRNDLSRREESFIVPHLIDVEVVSAIRRLVAGRRIGADRSDQFLAGLSALPAERYSHTPLLGRIWELRHNFTAYDATYIAKMLSPLKSKMGRVEPGIRTNAVSDLMRACAVSSTEPPGLANEYAAARRPPKGMASGVPKA